MSGELTLAALVAELTTGTRRAPRARRSATSAAAAESIAPVMSVLRQKVLDAIRSCGTHGATCDELEDLLALRHQTCSARVYELRNHEMIRDSGTRRMTRSNRQATVWVAS